MTDVAQTRHEAVVALTRRVTVKATLLVSLAASVALLYVLLANTDESWWFMPVSVLCGGTIGLLNFRWLALAVERKLLKKLSPTGPTNPAVALINGLKLATIFIVLFVVIKWHVLHLFGLIAGLSLCFVAIIWEGLALISSAHDREP